MMTQVEEMRSMAIILTTIALGWIAVAFIAAAALAKPTEERALHHRLVPVRARTDRRHLGTDR